MNDADVTARKFLFNLVDEILAGREKSNDPDDQSIDCSYNPIWGLCNDLLIVAERREDLAPFRAMDRDRARHVVESIVRTLGHKVEPWGDPLRVDDGEERVSYRCGWCGIGGVKLWRNPHGAYLSKIEDACRMHVKLLCRACVEIWKVDEIAEYAKLGIAGGDKLGGMLPAVPAPPDTYWGYTSVPEIRVQWWESLPDYDLDPIAAKIASSSTLARALLQCCRQKDRFAPWELNYSTNVMLAELHCVRLAVCGETGFAVATPTGLAVLARLPMQAFTQREEDDPFASFLHQRGCP